MSGPSRRSKWDQVPVAPPQTTPPPNESAVVGSGTQNGSSNGPESAPSTHSSDAASRAAAFLSTNLFGGSEPPKVHVGWVPPGTAGAGGNQSEPIFSGEVNINGCRPEIRYVMKSQDTFDQIFEDTGAKVVVRGVFMQSEGATANAANPDERPLHLYVTADSQDKVDKACAKLKIMMERPSTTPSGLLMNKVYIPFAADCDPAFAVQGKIIGPKGSFVKHIQTASGCKVHLRGRGSSYMEANSRQEAPEALHLFITGPTEEQVQTAKALSEKLIANVKGKYDAFLADKKAGLIPSGPGNDMPRSTSPLPPYDPNGPSGHPSNRQSPYPHGTPEHHSYGGSPRNSPRPHDQPGPHHPRGPSQPPPPSYPNQPHHGGSEYGREGYRRADDGPHGGNPAGRDRPPYDYPPRGNANQAYPPSSRPPHPSHGAGWDDRRGSSHPSRGPQASSHQPPPPSGPPPSQPAYPSSTASSYPQQPSEEYAANQAMTMAAYGYSEWTPEAIAAYYAYYGMPAPTPAQIAAYQAAAQGQNPSMDRSPDGARRFQENPVSSASHSTVSTITSGGDGEDMDMAMSDDDEEIVVPASRSKRPHESDSSGPETKKAKTQEASPAGKPAPPTTDKPFWASTTTNRSNVLAPAAHQPDS